MRKMRFINNNWDYSVIYDSSLGLKVTKASPDHQAPRPACRTPNEPRISTGSLIAHRTRTDNIRALPCLK